MSNSAQDTLDLHGQYTFKKTPIVRYVPLLVPIGFEAVAIYAKAPLPSQIIAAILFIYLLAVGFLPKITITDQILVNRNILGYTSPPVNLVRLSIIKGRSSLAGRYGIGAAALKLIDENNNHTNIPFTGWTDQGKLVYIIAHSPTGSNVDVNDAAMNILHFR